MLKRIGSRAADFDAAKTEIQAEQKKIDEEIGALIAESNQAIAKVEAAGANKQEIEDVKSRVQQIANGYLTEPNKSYISSLARLKDLLKAMVKLDIELARNYADIKKNLEQADKVNNEQLKVAKNGMDKANEDLKKEQSEHLQKRDELLTKVDQYQTTNGQLEAQVAALTTKIQQMQEDATKKLRMAQDTLREARDQIERKETVLDQPDGRLTFVDYGRGEVRTNLSHAMGARPQMNFTIFDSNAPGIPTEKPKGTIELIYVSNAYSIARIVKTFNPLQPMRTGDIVYSPAWSPNKPMRFALIGKLDVNRDGRDDREDLKRMIMSSGGIVDYDLPPPEAGKESGSLSGRDAWYVYDDPDERPPFVLEFKTGKEGTTNDQMEFLKKQSDAIKEARLIGVRPMPIGRLLTYLGYDYRAPIVGRPEGVDKASLRRLLAPKQRDQTKPVIPPAEGEGAPAATPENP
jgi:hypothetical protein